jgi:hypothetical protein
MLLEVRIILIGYYRLASEGPETLIEESCDSKGVFSLAVSLFDLIS